MFKKLNFSTLALAATLAVAAPTLTMANERDDHRGGEGNRGGVEQTYRGNRVGQGFRDDRSEHRYSENRYESRDRDNRAFRDRDHADFRFGFGASTAPAAGYYDRFGVWHPYGYYDQFGIWRSY